ncbi:MAG: Ohr family peroxiredoxin [Bryobacteraceae bacterium]|nr:Ohr family peroxiredoxin [Bryobacteraceae bacterium]
MRILYTAAATSIGGRKGHGATADGKLKTDFSVPKEMGGDNGKGVNPEQLFSLGYSSCFGSAIQHVAGIRKRKIEEIAVTAHTSIGRKEGPGGLALEVTLDIRLPDLPQAEAEEIVAEADRVCPYSNAIRGNVTVHLRVAGHKGT